jgi:predicted glycogen debranching enzyme
MLTSRDSLPGGRILIETANAFPHELMEREWLLTNNRGGFSSGTLAGCNTRRYHGLLVGTLNPPANRTMGLSCCREAISVHGMNVELGNFEFDGKPALDGVKYQVAFRRDIGVHFVYDLGILRMTKSIYLLGDIDTVAVVYDFVDVCERFEFSVRPFAAMRNFHGLQRSSAPLDFEWRGEGLAIRDAANGSAELFVSSDQMWFERNPQWWHNFLYRAERRRGQDCLEDLWSPGTFRCNVESPYTVILWAGLGRAGESELTIDVDLDIAVESLTLEREEILGGQKLADATLETLRIAADQFIVERQIGERESKTILAGYPWFLDWGRDSFIALPGLLLSTGRFEEAKGVLSTFAGAVDEGMIPNRFDDYDGTAHYNSIDASLWFVNAAFEYLHASGDKETFSEVLLPAIRAIVEAYRKGTRFGIHADEDGLITGGDADTQLTWMDAKCGGVAFTPRYGKAVEVNALWYNAMCNLREYYWEKDAAKAEEYGFAAERIGQSFVKAFWNQSNGYLNDFVYPDGTPETSLRPNQIYAVSLKHSALSIEQQKQVVEVVESRLLTPYGLRSLCPEDGKYVGVYEGDQMQRDRAYHNGTVWSHLMGAFVEAFVRVNGKDRVTKQEAFEFIEPLLDHFVQTGCVGSVSEIFDGDEPHLPRGCIAQAWSVGELLRVYKMVTEK